MYTNKALVQLLELSSLECFSFIIRNEHVPFVGYILLANDMIM